MLQQLQAAWRARRILLIGHADRFTAYLQALLSELGARCARIPPDSGSETLSRALHEGRIACMIVPCLRTFCPGPAHARLAALDTLLTEAREAGVPLVMLLSDESVYRAAGRPWYAREEDPIGGETPEGLMQSILQLYADGVSRGLLGDAVSVQCIRHMPCLGCGHPAVSAYDAWCSAVMDGEPLAVPHPGAQGVFVHPLDISLGAALLGARFLLGDRSCTGALNLGVGPQNLTPNRTAALRLCAALGHNRPIREFSPPSAIPLPLPDGSRARLLCGASTLETGEQALLKLFSLERAAALSAEAEIQIVRAQTLEYLKKLIT